MKEAAQLSIDELKRGGYRIVVNINETAQHITYNAFRDDDYFPGNMKGTQGTFGIMDQNTGEIVASIGGRNYRQGNLNRVTVKRQPGSTIKPIAVYGTTMMKKTYGQYAFIPDKKSTYDGYTRQMLIINMT